MAETPQRPSPPVQRATRGEDMLSLQRKFGYSQRDMMWILGLNPVSYRKAVKGPGGRSPLQMPVAMVIRLLRDHPEFSPIPAEPSAQEFFALCQATDPEFSPPQFAMLIGRAETSAYRWLKSTTPVSSKSARRWMLVMWRALLSVNKRAERKVLLDAFIGMVLDEAEARGYDRSVLERAHQWHLTNSPRASKLPSAIGDVGETAERMVSVPAPRSPARKPRSSTKPTTKRK